MAYEIQTLLRKKEDCLALGIWPTVTLAQARAKRDEAKKLLVQGIDPKADDLPPGLDTTFS